MTTVHNIIEARRAQATGDLVRISVGRITDDARVIDDAERYARRLVYRGHSSSRASRLAEAWARDAVRRSISVDAKAASRAPRSGGGDDGPKPAA